MPPGLSMGFSHNGEGGEPSRNCPNQKFPGWQGPPSNPARAKASSGQLREAHSHSGLGEDGLGRRALHQGRGDTARSVLTETVRFVRGGVPRWAVPCCRLNAPQPPPGEGGPWLLQQRRVGRGLLGVEDCLCGGLGSRWECAAGPGRLGAWVHGCVGCVVCHSRTYPFTA